MSDLQNRYTELQSAGRVPRYLELPGMRHMFEGWHAMGIGAMGGVDRVGFE